MFSSLKPSILWHTFSQICQIPRPSHHEQKITQYILDFAKQHELSYELDQTGNILLRKAATQGKAHLPSIALQAHMDMVPQKNEETAHNFLTDPITTYIDGEWVKAKGTTLGADNGIGLASALAVLIDPTIEHGPLEVLITASEETGMVGAFGLKPNWLQSRFLINTDSEDEGEIFTGCAGGVDFQSTFPISYTLIPDTHSCYVRLSVKGLKGGHSGCNIHLGRGNAIKLLIRFLSQYCDDISYRLSDIHGGSLRNAIPREAFADITINSVDLPKLQYLVQQYQTILVDEFAQVEQFVTFTATKLSSDKIQRVITLEHQIKIIHWLNSMPNGVIKMSQEIDGLVETSLNLGILHIENNQIFAYFLIRSQTDSSKDSVVSMLVSHSLLSQAEYEISGEYSGWKPDLNAKLLHLAKDRYQTLFSQEAKIMVIHAGLECGVFKSSYPDMEMISIGPTIVSPHSPDEKVHINSVDRYWQLLIAIIQSADKLI